MIPLNRALSRTPRPALRSSLYRSFTKIPQLPINLDANNISHAIFIQNLIGPTENTNPALQDGLNSPRTLPLFSQSPQTPSNLPFHKRILSVGKSYVKLYKNGIVNVWKNHQESKRIFKVFKAANVQQITQSIVNNNAIERIKQQDAETKQSDGPDKVESQTVHSIQGVHASIPISLSIPTQNHITRAQYQLLLRTPADFIKLPIFSLIFAVFFEMTPILVLILPQIVPSTCVLPYQTISHLKAVNANISSLKKSVSLPEDADNLITFLSSSVYKLNPSQILSLSKALNLGYPLIPLSFHRINLLRKKLSQHIDEIKSDDYLIGKFGGVWGLDDQELKLACIKRAM